jgi:presenilin-like A22 family membrane protease
MTVASSDPLNTIPICYVTIIIFTIYFLAVFTRRFNILVTGLFLILCSFLIWNIFGVVFVMLLAIVLLYLFAIYKSLCLYHSTKVGGDHNINQ